MPHRLSCSMLLLALAGCLPEKDGSDQSDDQSTPPSMADIEAPDVETPVPSDPPPDDPIPATVTAAPALVDLGRLDPRCSLGLEVTLTAAGDDAAGAYTVTTPEGWTATHDDAALESGSTTLLQLDWDGSTADPSGDVVVDFEGADSVVVAIRGLPELPSETLTVSLDDRAEADLLLAVDRSCNQDDMARLEPHWPDLRDGLADAGVSLRMAAVVEDDACVSGDPIVLDDTLDDEAFRDALWAQQNWGPDWGRYTEQLLYLSARALEAECNAALVQKSAPLHVLLFSDEPDQSELDWSVYVDRMMALPDPGVPLTVHAIGGDGDPECWAQLYTGAIEAVEQTGGVFQSFCRPDWANGMEALATGMAAANRRIVLSTLTDAVGEPVSVQNEREEVADWTWDGASVLQLPDSVPLRDEITVEYRLAATCE